jgi:hypothetical protein
MPVKMLEALDDVGKKVSMPNPDYATWVARDQFVQGWLNNSISPDILAYVLDEETTAETWAIISAMFKSAFKAKVSHLRTALNNTKKKKMTVEQYLYYWFRVGEATLQIHHLISGFTPNKKNSLLWQKHVLIIESNHGKSQLIQESQ